MKLFEIRLENDFIVFRGSEHESAGQCLKGVLVLCLARSLRVDEIHLRLTGTLRLTWTQSKMTATGVSSQKVDKTTPILQHRWEPFVGGEGKSVTLQAGNYEFPFEYMMPGNTAETLEGIPEASVSYRLKARVVRHRLASDIHTYKHLRVIRTLEPAALEFLHAMSVENIWPNKVDYSIVIPQKAVVFGGKLAIMMRFTPLLKGLEMGHITARLMEIRESFVHAGGIKTREHRAERETGVWTFNVTRRHHWRDTIEDTGQEGWIVEKKLDLPKRLRQCVQDLNQHGIKVRHKLKLTVALKNPDGHISELRATLPVSIFISPNMPLDEQGNLVSQVPGEAPPEGDISTMAPPGYGQHVLDQLYDDIDMGGFQTPAMASGMNSPYYQRSVPGSSVDLPQSEDIVSRTNTSSSTSDDITPAALTSRLQHVSLNPAHRNSSLLSVSSAAGPSSSSSNPLSRHTTRDESSSSGRTSPEHIDEVLEELNKVPSYATAVRTPARPRSMVGGVMLPLYRDSEGGGSPSSVTNRNLSISLVESAAARSRSPTTESLRRPDLLRLSGNNERPRSLVIPRPRTSRMRPLSGLSDIVLHRLSLCHCDDRESGGMRPNTAVQCV